MDSTEKQAYLERLKEIRDELNEIRLVKPRHFFVLKYPEYAYKKFKDADWNRLDNLWYGKIIDEGFMKKLEAFLTFKKVQFKS